VHVSLDMLCCAVVSFLGGSVHDFSLAELLCFRQLREGFKDENVLMRKRSDAAKCPTTG
jgi:hypothetical protein